MKHTKIILSVLATIASLVLVSCEKPENDNPGPEKNPLPEEFTLHYGDKVNLTDYVSEKSLFKSDDTWIAEVNDKGIVTAKHIGETTVSVLKAGTEQHVKIVVEARFDFFKEPLTNVPLEKVIETYGDYVSSFDDMSISIENGKPEINIKGKQYVFEDKTNDRIKLTYFYDLDNNFSKCKIEFKEPPLYMKELPLLTDIYQYIWERYKKDSDDIYWINKEETFRIILNITTPLDDFNGTKVRYLEYETIPHIN